VTLPLGLTRAGADFELEAAVGRGEPPQAASTPLPTAAPAIAAPMPSSRRRLSGADLMGENGVPVDM
jgi:hypothetical protein